GCTRGDGAGRVAGEGRDASRAQCEPAAQVGRQARRDGNARGDDTVGAAGGGRAEREGLEVGAHEIARAHADRGRVATRRGAQTALGERPFSGDVFVFRGRRGDLV